MSQKVTCPNCNSTLKISTAMAGKKGKCPKCSHVLVIPVLPPEDDLALERTELPPEMQTSGMRVATPSAASGSGTRSGTNSETSGGETNNESAVSLSSLTDALVDQSNQPGLAGSETKFRRQLETAFRGSLQPSEPTAMYKLGTVLVSLVMVLLPLAYIAFVGLTAYLVYYHTVYNVGMLGYGSGKGKILVFMLYVAPIVVGSIGTLFMIKPLFAPPGHESRTRSLTPAGQPLLFEFVDQLCEVVGSPKPKRIDVDYQLNASASFRRGWISLLGSDLVLTIGMPLVAGLTARQLTGVLAHEFGHFSQVGGMRLTFIVRNINAWFTRVVYQRDEWDEWLADATSEWDFRLSWILLLSQVFVFVSRCVLWVLMMIGHAVSGFMLRQMEFDADRYETRVVGSESFARTTLKMREMAVAYHLTQLTVMKALHSGKFPDNIPELLRRHHEMLSHHDLQKIHAAIQGEKTGLLDTHPCDKDRIASSQRENADGIFVADGPASVLFRNFDSTARNVTWDLYCAMGADIKMDDMLPVASMFDSEKAPADPDDPFAPDLSPLRLDVT